MPDWWLRSSAVADNYRDSCEHWLELYKPTLITSFLPVPDGEAATPDKPVGRTHPGSRSDDVSSSPKEERGTPRDRLQRRKFTEKKRQIFQRRVIAFPILLFLDPFLEIRLDPRFLDLPFLREIRLSLCRKTRSLLCDLT